METTINDKTTIALFPVMSFLMVAVGSIVWLTTLHLTTNSTAEKVVKIEANQEDYTKDLQTIKEQLVEIKILLKQKR